MTTPEPFSTTYQRFLPSVRARCRRILRSDATADDVVQETFARLWKVGPDPSTTDPRTLLAWLYRTSTRIAIDAIRDRRRGPILEQDPSIAGADPDSDASIDAKAALAALSSTVPAQELEVAYLARVDGLSQPDVATKVGVSERSVRRLLRRFDDRASHVRLLAFGLLFAIVMLASGRACAVVP